MQLSPSAPAALYTESFYVQVPESSTESRTHKEPSQPQAHGKVTQSIASPLPASSSCWYCQCGWLYIPLHNSIQLWTYWSKVQLKIMVKRAVIILDWSRLFCLSPKIHPWEFPLHRVPEIRKYSNKPEGAHISGYLCMGVLKSICGTVIPQFICGCCILIDVCWKKPGNELVRLSRTNVAHALYVRMQCCGWLTFLKCLEIEIKESCPWKSFITLPLFFKITIFSNFAVILWCSLCCYYCSFFAAALVRISMHYTRLKWNKTMSWKLWKTYSIL